MLQQLVELSEAMTELCNAITKDHPTIKPQAKTEQQPALAIHTTESKMQAVAVTSFVWGQEFYLKTDLLREVYWFVMDCTKDGNAFKCLAKNHLGTMTIVNLKSTDKLYTPIVEAVTPIAVEATQPVEISEEKLEKKNDKTLKVEKKKSKRGFKVTRGSCQLTAYGVKNTHLWKQGSDEVWRESFDWLVIQSLLEDCVLDSLIEVKQAYRVYELCKQRAVASGISEKALDDWWNALYDLTKVPVTLKGLVKA